VKLFASFGVLCSFSSVADNSSNDQHYENNTTNNYSDHCAHSNPTAIFIPVVARRGAISVPEIKKIEELF